jgi:hypothetical protein
MYSKPLIAPFAQACDQRQNYHKKQWCELFEEDADWCVLLLVPWVSLPLMGGIRSPLPLVPPVVRLEKATTEKHIENLIRINILFKMLLSKPLILSRWLIVPGLLSRLVIVPLLLGIC